MGATGIEPASGRHHTSRRKMFEENTLSSSLGFYLGLSSLGHCPLMLRTQHSVSSTAPRFRSVVMVVEMGPLVAGQRTTAEEPTAPKR